MKVYAKMDGVRLEFAGGGAMTVGRSPREVPEHREAEVRKVALRSPHVVIVEEAPEAPEPKSKPSKKKPIKAEG